MNISVKGVTIFMVLTKIIGIIFLLFLGCFVAIVIEETLLGGRRRRKLERSVRERRAGQEECSGAEVACGEGGRPKCVEENHVVHK
jgi:hypothetical protein